MTYTVFITYPSYKEKTFYLSCERYEKERDACRRVLLTNMLYPFTRISAFIYRKEEQ